MAATKTKKVLEKAKKLRNSPEGSMAGSSAVAQKAKRAFKKDLEEYKDKIDKIGDSPAKRLVKSALTAQMKSDTKDVYKHVKKKDAEAKKANAKKLQDKYKKDTY